MLTLGKHAPLVLIALLVTAFATTPASGSTYTSGNQILQEQQKVAGSIPGSFTAVPPARVLDTTTGNGAAANIPARSSIVVQISGRGGVPATGIASVVLNLQAVTPVGSGYLTLYAAGTARPSASNLNFTDGTTISTLAVAPLSGAGAIAIYNGSAAPIRVIADIAGYYLTGTPSAAGTFKSLAPTRILDTGSGVGAPANIPARGSITLQVGGVGGVPGSGVSSAVVNLQAVAPGGTGYLTLYAAGSTRPSASNLNFTAGNTISTLAVAPLSAGGAITVYNGSDTPARVIADLAGYHLAGTPNAVGAFGSLAPARALDTGAGIGAISNIPARGSITVQLNGRVGIPASGVSDVVLNLQAVTPSSAGYLTLHAAGSPRPSASNLNFSVNKTISTLAVAPVSDAGLITVYNGSTTPVRVIADVAGYHRTDIAIGALSWSTPVSTPASNVSALSCSSPTFCVAATYAGQAIRFNGATWSTPTTISAGQSITALSCVNATFCMAGDGAGRIAIFNGTAWTAPSSIGSAINSLSCVVANFCIAQVNAGGANEQFRSYNGSSWAAPTTAALATRDMSCPTATTCVAVATTFDQTPTFTGRGMTFNGTSWSAPAVASAGVGLRSVSCPTTTFCRAGSTGGNTTDVAQWNSGTWGTVVDVDGSFPSMIDLSCASPTLCVAVASLSLIGGSDGVEAYQYDGTSWSAAAHLTTSNERAAAVSCPTDRFCVTIFNSGKVTYGSRT